MRATAEDPRPPERVGGGDSPRSCGGEVSAGRAPQRRSERADGCASLVGRQVGAECAQDVDEGCVRQPTPPPGPGSVRRGRGRRCAGVGSQPSHQTALPTPASPPTSARPWPGPPWRRRTPRSVRCGASGTRPDERRRGTTTHHGHVTTSSHRAQARPLVCRGGLAGRARCDRRVRHRRGHGGARGVPTRPPATADDLRLDEAVGHVADDLPPEAQARLTYDEVRTLIRAEIEHLEDEGILAAGSGDPARGGSDARRGAGGRRGCGGRAGAGRGGRPRRHRPGRLPRDRVAARLPGEHRCGRPLLAPPAPSATGTARDRWPARSGLAVAVAAGVAQPALVEPGVGAPAATSRRGCRAPRSGPGRTRAPARRPRLSTAGGRSTPWSALGQPGQGLGERPFGLGVHGAGGLVQDQEAGIAELCPGQRHQLAFADREAAALARSCPAPAAARPATRPARARRTPVARRRHPIRRPTRTFSPGWRRTGSRPVGPAAPLGAAHRGARCAGRRPRGAPPRSTDRRGGTGAWRTSSAGSGLTHDGHGATRRHLARRRRAGPAPRRGRRTPGRTPRPRALRGGVAGPACSGRSIGVARTPRTLRQPAIAIWVWSRISDSSAIEQSDEEQEGHDLAHAQPHPGP